MDRIRRYVRDLWDRREFIVELARSNLKARNASTSLGLLWWVLNPLLLAGVYYLVFGVILGSNRPENFLGYLLSGIFPFTFTTASMTGGVNSMIGNASLLRNLKLPRLILPISAVTEAFIGYLTSLVALFVLALATSQFESFPSLWLLPVVMGLQVVFNLGLSAAVARLAIPFRDLNNLIPYVNRLWLYVSPIIWPISLLDNFEGLVRLMIILNPMTGMLSLYRTALLGYEFEPLALLATVVWASVVGITGVVTFVRNEGHIVRYL